MNAASINGRDFHEGLKYPSPAEKIIALGWYDGPTVGILQCRDGMVFKFHSRGTVLDWGEEGEDLQLYDFFPLPANSLEHVVSVLSPSQSPRWPLWVPEWAFLSEQEHAAVEKTLEEVELSSGHRQWIVASSDLLGEVVAAWSDTREVASGDVIRRLVNLAKDEKTRSCLRDILDRVRI